MAYVPPNKKTQSAIPQARTAIFSDQRWKREDTPQISQQRPPRTTPSYTTQSHTSQSHTSQPIEKSFESLQLDFPALPMKRAPTRKPHPESFRQEPLRQEPLRQPIGRVTYAALASNWAEQVKENEEKAKKAAEEDAILQQIRQKTNELKLVPIRQSLVAKKKSDSDDEVQVDIGCNVSDHSDPHESSDPDEDLPEEEEEEEPEEDPDAFWTQRKHKNDMY